MYVHVCIHCSIRGSISTYDDCHKSMYFINFSKQNKISIHQFIFSHYKKQTENNPSSMAIFEKNLRSIAYSIKDEFIKKYVLEFFLEEISELAPHTNRIRKNINNPFIVIN